MVIKMIKSENKQYKSRDIDYENEYKSFIEAASNPYDYNFGKRKGKKTSNFQKIQNKVNFDSLYKNF